MHDWVLVDRPNLQGKAGNKMFLNQKSLESSMVMKVIPSYTFQLDVFIGISWHNVVHTTLLKPFNRQDESQDRYKNDEEM